MNAEERVRKQKLMGKGGALGVGTDKARQRSMREVLAEVRRCERFRLEKRYTDTRTFRLLKNDRKMTSDVEVSIKRRLQRKPRRAQLRMMRKT